MKKIKKRYYVLTLLLIICIYVICNAISIWNYANVDETRTADVAIILGAAAFDDGISPVFRERINHGIWLYKNGYVKKIIISGGYGEGNQYSDAYIGYLYAIEQGVPGEDILLEEQSTITEENLKNAKVIMDNNGFTSALIVSDPLHMKRAMLLTKDAGIDGYSAPTTTTKYVSLKTKIPFLFREVFFYVGYKIVNII